MPFTAFDETGIVGFFTLRNPGKSFEELRFGFVIIKPDMRGKGYGKDMLRLGIKLAFDVYGAKRASLGVFENKLAAYNCYKSVGFKDKIPDDIDYDKIDHISSETKDKLNKIRPKTLAQASRIGGVKPADISILMVLLERHTIARKVL